VERESMEFDVLIVGAGPAGLSAACRIQQLSNEAEQELTICVVERDRRSVLTSSRARSSSPPVWMSCSRTGRSAARP